MRPIVKVEVAEGFCALLDAPSMAAGAHVDAVRSRTGYVVLSGYRADLRRLLRACWHLERNGGRGEGAQVRSARAAGTRIANALSTHRAEPSVRRDEIAKLLDACADDLDDAERAAVAAEECRREAWRDRVTLARHVSARLRKERR